jgi:GTP-binding protein
VEQYAVIRAFYAIRRADVVMVIVDSVDKMTEQDVRLCGYVHEQGKPSLIVMNKWDLIEKDTHTIEVFKKEIETDLKFMDYYVPVFVSALTGQRIDKLMENALSVYANSSKRVMTGQLNDIIMDAVRMNEPPSYKGRKLKIFYTSQVTTNPPTFAFFVNDINLMHFSYRRYLENEIRKAFDFRGTPIRFSLRAKNEDDILN